MMDENLFTEARIRSGETLLLGGLIISDLECARDAVPILGDIPVLGRAFQFQRERKVFKHLLLMLRVELEE